MKEYKNINCLPGDYFDCPETVSTIEKEKIEKKDYDKVRFRNTKDYKKSIVTKKSYTLYEK